MTKGSGFYEVKNQRCFVKEGDIFIIYPYELISYYSPDPAKTWSFCWIGFSGDDAPHYAALAGLTDYTRTVNQEFFSLIWNAPSKKETPRNQAAGFSFKRCINRGGMLDFPARICYHIIRILYARKK